MSQVVDVFEVPTDGGIVRLSEQEGVGAWLAIRSRNGDYEAVKMTPGRARQIADKLAEWADARARKT